MTSTSQLRVLVVDDDQEIRSLLTSYLGAQGVAVSDADSEEKLLIQIGLSAPHVILLDVNLGTEDGFSIARRLRQSWQGGLIMLTGRSDTIDRVVGLEIGADDYVAKPFELRELLARIRSVGRRSTEKHAPASVDETRTKNSLRRLKFARFTLIPESRELRDAQGQMIALTTGEFNLLLALTENQGRVLSRDTLLGLTHHREAGPFDRTIDVQVGRLRKKLGDDCQIPAMIKSVRGQGYLFTLEVRESQA